MLRVLVPVVLRLAEDPRILLPARVCQDAFVLSHSMMQTEIPSIEEVERFLPPLELPQRLTDRALTVRGLDFPHETEAHRRQHEEAMRRVPAVHRECQDAFEEVFGRRLADAVVPTARTTPSSCCSRWEPPRPRCARPATAREAGLRAGALRVRMFRPFPERELHELLAGRERIGVIDRSFTLT